MFNTFVRLLTVDKLKGKGLRNKVLDIINSKGRLYIAFYY